MQSIVNLFALVASYMSATGTVNNSSEVVHFTGNDIGDNVISRDYSAKLKVLNTKSIEMFGGNQLTSTIAATHNYSSEGRKKYKTDVNKAADDWYYRNVLAIERDRMIVKAAKKNMGKDLLRTRNDFVQDQMKKWDERAEEFYMLTLLPKLCVNIVEELLDTEMEKQSSSINNKIDNNIEITQGEETFLNNINTIYELLDNQKIPEMLALFKLMVADEQKLHNDKQKINKIKNYCLYAQTKFSMCFGNSNEYFIFIGDNPDNERPHYKIESILPRKYLHKKTELDIVIPGSIGGSPVLLGKNAFFSLFHCNEQLMQNIRMKIIFQQTDGQMVSLPSNMSNMFDDFQYGGNGLKVMAIDFNGAYFPDSICDMSSMFRNCGNLKQLDLSNFDTSAVEYMDQMFSRCINLEKLNISNFDTSNVANMEQMFCSCERLQELDLSNFNTKNVKDMSKMFYKCKNLRTLDLSNFDVSNIKHLSDMFAGCKNLIKVKIKHSALKQLLKKDKNLFADCCNLQTTYA